MFASIQSFVGSRFPDRINIHLIGGGIAADLVRRWQIEHQLSDEASHWLAISAMRFNAELVAAALQLPLVDRFAPLADFPVGSSLIFDPHPELREFAADLPMNWQTTSDSIAGWVAKKIHAEILILAKSVGHTEGTTVVEASARGWVDDFFPTISQGLKVVWYCPQEDFC